MRAPVVVAVAASAVLVPTLAVAAPHTLPAHKVASGSAAVASCGSLSGVRVSWTSQANTVVKVTLGSIPSSCNGGLLSVTLVSATDASLGTAGPATVTATSMTLPVTGAPTATSVSSARLVVVGP